MSDHRPTSILLPVAAVLLLPIIAALSGCRMTHAYGRFSVISTQRPDGLDVSGAPEVSGTSYRLVLGNFIPLSRFRSEFDVAACVREALAQAPGTNLLVDAEVTRYVNGVPGVLWVVGVKVTGRAVTYKPDLERVDPSSLAAMAKVRAAALDLPDVREPPPTNP
jgi:hypothetical protein